MHVQTDLGVSAVRHHLGMTNFHESDPSATAILPVLDQARWLAERYEANSDGFQNRAAIIIGSIGVELALLADRTESNSLFSIFTFLLLVPGAIAVFAMRPRRFRYPDHSQFSEAISGKRHGTWLVCEQLLKQFSPEENLITQIKRESESRGYAVIAAFIGFVIVQAIILFILLFWGAS